MLLLRLHGFQLMVQSDFDRNSRKSRDGLRSSKLHRYAVLLWIANAKARSRPRETS